MVGGTRRRLSPEERRLELLEAAVRVLRDRGAAGCRVEDVTAAAGTAKGNFYRYFPTWDDLLVAVRRHLLDGYGEEFQARYGDLAGIDWWAALEEEIDRYLEFLVGLGGLHEAVFHGPAGARPAASRRPMAGDESATSAESMLSSFLSAGMAEGAFGPVDTEITATLIFEMLHGAADAIATGRDQDEVRKATRHLLHGGLRAGSGPLR